MQQQELQYAGFWVRVGATLVDALLIWIVSIPVLIGIYGWEYFEATVLILGPADFVISWVFPAVAVITFWIIKQATPGKMAIGARILDAKSGQKPTPAQCIGRYFAYFVSLIPLGLGILWVAFDPRKQGWHDKLAGTVVVRNTSPESVTFPGEQ